MKIKTWQNLRKIAQITSLAIFAILFTRYVYLDQSAGWSDIFYRLDPLVAITSMLAGRVFIATLALALITIVLTLIFGRVWCGWFCPLGTILEWTTPNPKRKPSFIDKLPIKRTKINFFFLKWIIPKKEIKSPVQDQSTSKWRKVKYLLLISILVAVALGNQTLLFLDPNTILTRSMSAALWPAIRYGVYRLEKFLFQFKALWPVLDFLHANIVIPLFHNLQAVFSASLITALIFIGLILLNRLAERFWCRYLCPLGGLLGWLSRFALLRREVSQPCTACGLCNTNCPTGTIDAENGYRSDPAECIVCLNCLGMCKQKDVAFRWQLKRWKPSAMHSYDPSRREALTAIAAAAGGVALAGIEPNTRRSPARMIRPPGALLTDFESLCIRCGECVRVCPTQGLQLALFESGWQNLMTSHLVPRLGYCAFNCNACSQVCPTGAIPPLTLSQKHGIPIGLASINKDRCLPWAYGTPCVVCEEMCPIPDKAIVFEQGGGRGLGNSEGAIIQRPRVLREKCIGCGVCEFYCPVGGEAAIQVFSIPDSKPPLSGI